MILLQGLREGDLQLFINFLPNLHVVANAILMPAYQNHPAWKHDPSGTKIPADRENKREAKGTTEKRSPPGGDLFPITLIV